MGHGFRRRCIWIRSRTTRAWRALKSSLRSIPWSIRAAVPLLVVVVGSIWAFHTAGLLDVSGKDTTGNRLTAVLTLVGVFVTASVAFLGHAVSRQGEARQAVDSSISAMGLLAKPDGSPSEPLTAGAGLLAVANLGQLGLAMSLLSDLWGKAGADGAERVSRDAAITLIDQAVGLSRPDNTNGCRVRLARKLRAALETSSLWTVGGRGDGYECEATGRKPSSLAAVESHESALLWDT